ncbi:MAG TPA: ABC transporter permease [Dehalococcoidia bacterium]|nr:ABC transporter permease [Dehalococcoidia bacterium]
MTRYMMARLVAVIPTLLILLLFVVILVRLLPGDAVDIMLQDSARAGDVDRTELESRLGLDRSVPEEFFSYSADAFRGDLGRSVWSRQPVTDMISDRIGVTLELTVLSLVVATVIGIFVGVVSAVRQNSWLDYLLRGISIAGLSVPNFALATMVVVLPTIWWGWSPSLIYTPPSEGLWDHISQFFLPAIILGLALSATLMRITRTMMLEVLRQDYIRTARAKGLRGRIVITRHALRNAMIPVVSLLGIQVAFLLSGAVIIENVFALPGIGRTLIASIAQRDYPVVQGITVVSGVLVIASNLVVDLSYAWIDPRAKLG